MPSSPSDSSAAGSVSAADSVERPVPRIREQLEDFQVVELADGPPPQEGDGEHLHLWIEKRGVDTARVADQFAGFAGVARGKVGFAGRKDRRAVTRQWFSVPLARAAEEAFLHRAEELEEDGVKLLEARRGRRRLRLGEHRGNAFELRVRGVSPSQAEHAQRELAEIQRRGLPNRFGAQRFGRHGANVERGLRLLLPRPLEDEGAGAEDEGTRENSPRGGHRRLQRLLIAAVQSQVFNQILERRPCPVWEVVPGDVVRVHRSDRLRLVTDSAAEAERLASFRISPTAPLFGPKVLPAQGEIAALETAVFAEYGLQRFVPGSPDADGAPELPKALRPWGERRDLRIPVREAVASFLESDQGSAGSPSAGDLLLRFQLPPGAYATVLLEELLPEGVRVSRVY
ncbi:MAG: tRNA pseudouridine(13) synthase TruD [Acidobacteriota bacterium]